MPKIVPMARAKNKFSKRILFTHTDLDGVGCAVIYNKCFPDVQTYFTDPEHVNLDVAEIVSREEDFVPVMIADLSVKPEIAEYLDQRGNVELIDHHHYTAEKLNVYPWCIVDESACATKLMFNVMSTRFTLDDYKLFVDIVDNYDRWGEGKGPTDHAQDMSRLCFLLGHKEFLKGMLRDSSIKFSEAETFLINVDKEAERRYIAESLPKVIGLTDQEGNTYGLISAERYISALGHAIIHQIPEIEYAIILDYHNDKVHLRSKGKVDVGVIAMKCGGGGHHRAAGFPMQQGAYKVFTSCDGSNCEIVADLMEIVERVKKIEGGRASVEENSKPN